MSWTQADYNAFLARQVNHNTFLEQKGREADAARLRVSGYSQSRRDELRAHARRQISGEGVEDEIRDLHKPIIAHCRRMGWIYLYSNPARKTGRTLFEQDFTILADRGRTFFIECKSRRHELSPGQTIFYREAAKLGHTIHVVYTMEQFYELVK